MSEPSPRQLHYDEFYGWADRSDGRPLGWVHGNCQAESLRQQLEGPDLRTVRVPPVHELEAEDLPHLARLSARTDVLVSQPVRPDYRDLPVGLEQLTSVLPPGARVARMPVVRFAGLYPTHAIIRPPEDPSLNPPLVAYHDLTTLWAAHVGSGGRARPVARLTVPQVRAVAAHSIEELRRREDHHRTVRISDLFATPRFSQMRTINHPGNEVWLEMSVRVRRELRLDTDVIPLARPLLDSVHAPRSPVVAEANGLDVEPEHDCWRVDGEPVPVDVVRQRHLEWYDAHPGAVAAGIRRHHDVLSLLGLAR